MPQNEIERKFFVKSLPDLSGIKPLHYERYFLKRKNGVEERISKINHDFVYEKKVAVSALVRSSERNEISEQEFNRLKEGLRVIIRDRYNLSSNPDIAIQIYHGKFNGLIRAEVEFETEVEAKAFVPLPWMGKELTGLPIASDSKLLDLTASQFKKFLAS